jgi:hypothetical protein
MRKTFVIPLPTVSINSFYYANKRHGIRAEAREWQHKFFHYLSQSYNADKLAELRNAFDETKHGYTVDFTFGVPASKLINKSGGLSSRAIDLSNCEKSIIDVLFLPKHFNEKPPYGCKNLNIDDKFLLGLSSKKIAAESEGIAIAVTIVDRKSYCEIV